MQEVIISNYRDWVSGSVRGMFNIEFPEIGMIIKDLRFMETDGKNWIAYPNKEFQKGGQKQWMNYIAFNTPEQKEAMQDKIMEALSKMVPQKDKPQPKQTEEAW